jgi:uncharacterized membrane protein
LATQKVTHNRLVFIDIARSIAILMMLEGHFIVMALSEDYRGNEYFFYDLWRFTRGLTAPLFFTVSGLVFTYLLVRKEEPFFNNIRVKKGLSRTVKLILWGYALQLNLFYLIKGDFSGYLYIFHVLQCIGLSLFVVILLFGVYKLLRVVPFFLILALGGLLGFILKPTIYGIDFSGVHPIIENIFVVTTEDRSFKSIFPLFPWVGFTLLGGMVGAFVSKRPQHVYTNWFPMALTIIAILFNTISDVILFIIQPFFQWFGVEPFVGLGYLLARFGQGLFVFAIIIIIGKHKRYLKILYYRKLSFLRSWLIPTGSFIIGITLLVIHFYHLGASDSNEKILISSTLSLSALGQFFLFLGVVITSAKLIQWNYNLFIKIGQNTLSIYIIHVMILYAGLFGFGLNKIINRALGPWYAIVCAIAFMLFFTYFVKHIDDIKEFYKRAIPRKWRK